MSRSVLSIQIDDCCAVAVQGRVEGARLVLEQAITVNWREGASPADDAAQAGLLLRERLTEAGVTPRGAIAVLSRDAVTLKYLELVAADDAELAQLVQFQAEGRSPVPLDELCLDYLPLPYAASLNEISGRRVLLAMARKERVRAYCATLEAAGCAATSLGLSSAATMEILARQAGWPSNGLTLCISRRGNDVETLFSLDGCLMQAVTLSAPETDGDHDSAVLAAIARTLVSLSDSLGGRDFQAICLLGDPVEEAPLARRMEQETDRPVLVIDPLAGCEPAELRPGIPRSWLAGPVGAIWAQASATVPQLDFLQPRRPRIARGRSPLRVALVAVLLVCVGVYVWLAVQWRREQLDRELANLASQEQSLRDLLKRGQPTSATVAAMGEWSAARVEPLDEVLFLIEQMPAADRAYLSLLQLESGLSGRPSRLTASGYARQRDDVTNFNLRLLQRPDRYRPQPHGIQMSPKDQHYGFRFDAEALLVASSPPQPESSDENSPSPPATPESAQSAP